ncbi:MAG: hypothetical protein LBV43_05910 [Prevotella sp.]|jgi:hypothetical protein|nr:hypothetical protein [Prevotella sp.]
MHQNNLSQISDSTIKNQYWIFFSVLVFLALFMMFCNGLSSSYSGFDFFFHYRRLYALIEALKDGTYISYIDYSNADGYGYMIKPFYSDVILIPFAFIGIFTSVYCAYDVMIFTMTVLSGIFMYHMMKVIYKNDYAASIGGILYAFAIYRLHDIYQRGALGESLSFTFLPIVFLGLYHIIKGDYKKWYILAIGYSLLIYSHVIASVLLFVLLLVFLVIYYKSFVREPKRITYLLVAGVVTLIITSYYIFPTLEQLTNSSFYLDARNPGGGAGYGKVGFDFILWGFISGLAYIDNELWAGIGIILTLVILLRLFIKWDKSAGLLKNTDILVIIGICLIIATSRIFPWGRFPFNLISFIQYPWRLYEFVSFFFAVAGGYYISLLFIRRKQQIAAFTAIVLLTMITIYIHSENFKSLFPPEKKVITTESSYFNRYQTIGGEYFPTKLPAIEYIYQRGEVVDKKNNDTKITAFKREKNLTILDVTVNKADTLTLPLLYYYGYNVTLNGNNIDFNENDYGLIQIFIDKSGKIEAYYKGTIIQQTSFYISSISAILLIIFIIISKRKKENGQTR